MSAEDARLDLERLLTTVATQLMAANAATAVAVSRQVLAGLVEHFGTDAASLRHHDHSIGASVLVAEWPIPSGANAPMSVAFVNGTDPLVTHGENLRRPNVFLPDGDQPTVAAAPLVSGDLTTGVLGLATVRERVWRDDELNALEAISSLFAQVQARVKAEAQLRDLAEHDDLTGSFNRRALLALLEERLAAGQPAPVSVLFFDLDRLKTINDYLGHTAGDRFLRVVASRIRHHTEPATVIARLGGDEFVAIPPPPTSAAEAEHLAETLLPVLSERVSLDGELLTRSVSIGVAHGIPGRSTTTDLMRHADQALLMAKAAGGDQVATYSPELAADTELRTDIELHLATVIAEESLFLRYLPEVDMRTGAVLAAEALVRWDHPTHGPISPEAFIPVAESINLAGELGRWVMRTACAEFAQWRAKGIGQDITLRINVSPAQLVMAGFAESVADIMAEFGLARGAICLEITESVVVQDIDTTRITLAGLKEAGVQIAIDDFGTGYSVLSHLKSLPVDVLKIDRSFVTDLGSNPDDLAIVRAVIALAEAFGLELVAEGVETEAAAITLLRHGCHRAQGFLLSPPISGDELGELLERGRVSAQFPATPAG